MISNLEVFFNFLADRFYLTDYIIAYTKRYNICLRPFYRTVNAQANRNPKGLFSDILGSGHKFKELEQRWIEYVDDTINYFPKENDKIYCAYLNEKTYDIVSWIDTFGSGTKEEYISKIDNKVHNEQTFVRKLQ